MITCVVFDFGFTLSSDRYFKLLGAQALKQVDEMMTVREDPHISQGWATGLLSSQDVANYLSSKTGLAPDIILSALYEGCAQITFNEAVWNFAQQQEQLGRKTALVTVNFDVFNEVVVPNCGLDTVFDAIVNSSDYGTGDKEKLWSVAFDMLGEEYGYSNSLLIEDSADQVRRFRNLGGIAHRYTDDAAFGRWLSSAKLNRSSTT